MWSWWMLGMAFTYSHSTMLCVRKILSSSSEVNICLLFLSGPSLNGKTFLSKTNEQSLKEYPDMQFSLVSDAKIYRWAKAKVFDKRFQNSKSFTDNYQISLINHCSLLLHIHLSFDCWPKSLTLTNVNQKMAFCHDFFDGCWVLSRKRSLVGFKPFFVSRGDALCILKNP